MTRLSVARWCPAGSARESAEARRRSGEHGPERKRTPGTGGARYRRSSRLRGRGLQGSAELERACLQEADPLQHRRFHTSGEKCFSGGGCSLVLSCKHQTQGATIRLTLKATK